jgi:TPR repeat protein
VRITRIVAAALSLFLLCAGAASAPPAPESEKLQPLLREGRLDELDALFASYQEAYRAGAINDEAAAAPYIALSDNDPDLRPMYDRWVAEFPQSYPARLMRGYFLMQLGYLARGSEYTRNTPKARFDEMRAHFQAAMEDLEASLKLDAKPALSYGTMIAIAQAMGDEPVAAAHLEAAMKLDPGIYTARASYLMMLRPEWGGSIERMQEALSNWKASLEEPQWRRLNDLVESSRWRAKLAPLALLVERKQYAQAIAGYTEVLAQTEVLRALAMRGYSYAQLGQHDKAIADFTRVLEIDASGGCCPGTRSNRARSYLHTGAKDKALADLLIAARNDDQFAARELAMIYAFGRHGFKRDYAAARPWCERAAKQGDGLAMYCLGGMYHAGLGAPKDLASAAYWFGSAAVRGIADAQTDLGVMFWQGQGVPQDRERAAQWWRLAAAKGNARAADKLRDHGLYWSYFRYVVLGEWLREWLTPT